MKKITSTDTFEYRIDGSTVISISPEGSIVTDEQAEFIKNRLSAIVTLEDVDIDTEIAKVIEPEAEVAPVEETAPVAQEEEIINDEDAPAEAPVAEPEAEVAPEAKPAKGGKKK